VTHLLSAFDVLLVTGLLGLSWLVMASRDLFRAVVLFIGFGLLLSLAWVRLGAADIALAEAAIGAGLTGVLLLNTTACLRRRETVSEAQISTFAWFLPGFLCAAGGCAIALLVADLAGQEGGLAGQVQARMAASGVSSPVTAVLLNFRGYDTLLEIGVLALAVIGLASLLAGDLKPLSAEPVDDPVLSGLARRLFPVAVLVAGYLLWSGTHAPGGAFQAGAVLGSGGVLLHLAGFTAFSRLRSRGLRALFVFGFCVFLTVAGGVVIAGNRLLEYPPGRARELIVLIESALMVSIGFMLAGLIIISSPPRPRDHFPLPGRGETS